MAHFRYALLRVRREEEVLRAVELVVQQRLKCIPAILSGHDLKRYPVRWQWPSKVRPPATAWWASKLPSGEAVASSYSAHDGSRPCMRLQQHSRQAYLEKNL